jgi:glucose/arabinose dehydrogenase
MARTHLKFCAAAAAFALLVVPACGNDQTASRRVVRSPAPDSPVPTFEPPGATATTPDPDDPSQARVSVPRTPSPVPEQASRLAQARVKVTRLGSFTRPLAFTHNGDGAFYIVEKGGRIQAFRNGTKSLALNISDEVSTGSEQGLLGAAFSGDGRLLYVNFTDRGGDTVIREYAFSGGRADTSTARLVLGVDQPYGNHNGGHLIFGPDRNLYIGLGDGGSGGDPDGNGQNLNVLLGKMLRIDPRASGTRAYTIPSDNPFAGPKSGRDEIWAYGLRNPWRYSFDRDTGDLYIADVGQGNWEEVNFASGASKGGENFGWNRFEGTHTFRGSPPPNHTGPVYEYRNDGTNCAVTGGYVYRGSAIPDLRGAYVFADYCGGQLRAFLQQGGRVVEDRMLGVAVSDVSSFGEDAAGELYVLSLSGSMYKLERA